MTTLKTAGKKTSPSLHDCKTYNFAGRTGIAILTSNYHFYVANNVEEVRSRRYYDPPGKKIHKVKCFREINHVLFLSYMFVLHVFVIYRTQYLLVSHFPLVISLNLMRVKVLFNRQ